MNRFFSLHGNVIFSAKHSEEQLLYITCGFHAIVLFCRFYALTLLEILQ